jgi:hypothetical protein
MAVLDTAIHGLLREKAWITGPSPVMTKIGLFP